MADITITPANVLASATAPKSTVTAGEAVAAGETVYKNADGKRYRAVGTDAAKMPVEGMALNSASAAGQPLDIVKSDVAPVIGAHGIGTGIPIFQSANAGKVCQLADVGTGNLTTCIGVTNSATEISFNPIGGKGARA